jgi:hypothetical protein
MSPMVADPQVTWYDGPHRRPGVVRSIRDVLATPLPSPPATAPTQTPVAGGTTLAGLVIAGLWGALGHVVRAVAPYLSMTSAGLGAFVVAGFTLTPVVGWAVAGAAALLAEFAVERKR